MIKRSPSQIINVRELNSQINKDIDLTKLTALQMKTALFSSPGVSCCAHPLSVVRRVPFDVRLHSRGHSFDPFLMKLAQSACLFKFLG